MHRQIERLLINKERELKTILNVDAPDSYQNNKLKQHCTKNKFKTD